MGKLLWGILLAAATAVAALSGAGIPSDFWGERRVWVVPAIVVLAFAALRPFVLSWMGDRTRAGEAVALEALKAAYVTIVESTELDWKEIGLHAFIVKRSWPRLWEQHQVLLARWRLKSAPTAAATIRWTKDKGLIGRCWELQQIVGANTARDWGDDELTEAQWDELDDALRYGFSYEEHLRVREYGAVAAVPMIGDGGRYLGCISIDSPGPAFEIVMDDLVLEALHDAGLWIKETARKLSRA